MCSIREKGPLANLPAEELMTSLRKFLAPVLAHLPETRLRAVGVLAVRGILAAQSPVLTGMARGGQPADALNWPLAKRFYRFVANARFNHRDLLKGLCGIAQCAVARYPRPYLVVAIDPVNVSIQAGARAGKPGGQKGVPSKAKRSACNTVWPCLRAVEM